MHVVIVSVAESELSTRMADMRRWLDRQRIEPEIFRYTREMGKLVFRVEFKSEDEAMAFAQEFHGRVLESDPGIVKIL